jgi:hypothetical protein
LDVAVFMTFSARPACAGSEMVMEENAACFLLAEVVVQSAG